MDRVIQKKKWSAHVYKISPYCKNYSKMGGYCLFVWIRQMRCPMNYREILPGKKLQYRISDAGLTNMYKGIKILLATKHNKEEAIREPFADHFSAQIYVPNDYDTDQYGTFSGEIKRTGTPLETVIKKAQGAISRYHCQYAIANEGSFGPHPLYCFFPIDMELMVFIDRENKLTVIETEISTETNFAHQDISSNDDYSPFLSRMKFGTHGLIIKNAEDNQVIAKGITQINQLEVILNTAFAKCKKIRLETDMRAMLNPTRMKVIHSLAQKLAIRLKNSCAKCQSPGFGKKSTKGKLKCEDCGTDTELHQFNVLSCIKCDHAEINVREDGRTKADPKHCPYCNP